MKSILFCLILLTSSSALADYIRTGEARASISKYLGFASVSSTVSGMDVRGKIVPFPKRFKEQSISKYEDKGDYMLCRMYPNDLEGRIYKREGDKYKDLGKPNYITFHCKRAR